MASMEDRLVLVVMLVRGKYSLTQKVAELGHSNGDSADTTDSSVESSGSGSDEVRASNHYC
jgi:hypothetical protein